MKREHYIRKGDTVNVNDKQGIVRWLCGSEIGAETLVTVKFSDGSVETHPLSQVSPLSEEEPMALTAKEREVFEAIFTDQYSDGTENACPWSWSVAGTSKSRAGCLSSLQKKGLIQTEGTGKDAICYYTDAGKKLLRDLGII